MDAATITSWMREINVVVRAERDHLVQLDAAIGDGDHGTNMVRGFEAVDLAIKGAVEADGGAPPGKLLILAGRTLVSTVGGASGPLWGSALRSGGRVLGDQPNFGGGQLVEVLAAALASVKDLGTASVGDKTMVARHQDNERLPIHNVVSEVMARLHAQEGYVQSAPGERFGEIGRIIAGDRDLDVLQLVA